MVHLVLNAHRQSSLGSELEGVPPLIERPYRHLGSARDQLVIPRHREASFLALRLALQSGEFGIDEDIQLVPGLADIDHDDPLVYVYLSRREADAWRRIHGFSHVADQLLDLRGHRRDRRGDLPKPGVGVFENWELRHKCLQNTYSGCRMSIKPLFCGGLECLLSVCNTSPTLVRL